MRLEVGMAAVTDERRSDDARMPTSEEVRQAFAVLGLDPSAGPDLVDLAYWHLVDEARATLHGTPAWRTRLTELNAARARLSDHLSLWRRPARPQADAPTSGTGPVLRRAAPPGGRQGRRRYLAAALLLLAALLAVALVREGGPVGPERVAAAGVILALSMACALLIPLPGRGGLDPAPTGAADNPHRLLRLHPHASPSLAAVVYEHLRRAAAHREDLQALAELERAYARLCRAAQPAEAAAASAAAGGGRRSRFRPSVPRWLRRFRPLWRRPRRSNPSPPGHDVGRGNAGRASSSTMGAPSIEGWGQPWVGGPHTEEGLGAHSAKPSPADVPGPAVRAVGALRVLRGAEEVLAVPLVEGGVYTIGTAAHCHVVLPESAGVADEHARITVRRGRVRFHHLAAAGSSLVNGEPATWVVLEPGDEIRVGPYRCRYLAADGSAVGLGRASWPAVRESAPAVHTPTLPSPPTRSP
jgi:hypothetical protein